MSLMQLNKPTNTRSTLHIMERIITNCINLLLIKSMPELSEIKQISPQCCWASENKASASEGKKSWPGNSCLRALPPPQKTHQENAAKSQSPALHPNYIPHLTTPQTSCTNQPWELVLLSPNPRQGAGWAGFQEQPLLPCWMNDWATVLLNTNLIQNGNQQLSSESLVKQRQREKHNI